MSITAETTATRPMTVRERLSAPRWVMDGMHGPHWYSLHHNAPCCGTGYGYTGERRPCEPVACMLCGTVQCFSNGLGNGRCKCCSHGFLPGWSGNSGKTCGYAKCGEPAVAVVPGKKLACVEHARRKVGADVERSIAIRDSGQGWQHWTFTGPRVAW